MPFFVHFVFFVANGKLGYILAKHTLSSGAFTMDAHVLDSLFDPNAIAVFGASERPDSVGGRVFRNLANGGGRFRLHPINPKHPSVLGYPCSSNLGELNEEIDLAIIATPAPTVNDILRQCGEAGVRIAVILSAGFRETGEQGKRLEKEMRETAAQYGLRLMGPNALGFMRPLAKLDATFLDTKVQPGRLALLSQSGALCTAILDWAGPQNIGFSAVVSLGNATDLDFGELLDYLSLDPHTGAILLYVEGVNQARGFISGLRTASRMKPVIVLKVGRHQAASRAAMTHTGAMVGADGVFDAALERAGVVRVFSVGQLFVAAELLASGARARGNRLAIITNGGGPGALASDRCEDVGVALAELGDESLKQLDALLPAHWSHANPIDILGDAPPEHYGRALEICLADRNVDGILMLLTPQAMTRATEAARTLIEVAGKRPAKPVLACWMGETKVAEARALLAESQLPSFETPEGAVEAFGYLANHYRNQQLLLQTPKPLGDWKAPDVEGARLIIEGVLAERRQMLSDVESKAILAAFHIPSLPTHEVRSANEALILAQTLGFPVAMKISSPDISHKSDVNGVILNVASAQEVRQDYELLLERVARLQPEAKLNGVTIEPMARLANARELMVGVVRDPVFGPAISFGAGGIAVEIESDNAIALPPLNRLLARRLIERTRVAKLLGPFRNRPAVDMQALLQVLLRVSEMVCELPQIQELDINPLLISEEGIVAVDARMLVKRPRGLVEPYAHMAIHPYPGHLQRRVQLPSGINIIIRPIRPEDADKEQEFVRQLSPRSRYFRFMQALKELTPEMLVRFTAPDYDREMALVALVEDRGQEGEQIAVARYSMTPNGKSCEFALVVGDGWHQRGIGTLLMESLMEAARARGLRRMEGDVLTENVQMLKLCELLGFRIRPAPDDPALRMVSKDL